MKKNNQRDENYFNSEKLSFWGLSGKSFRTVTWNFNIAVVAKKRREKKGGGVENFSWHIHVCVTFCHEEVEGAVGKGRKIHWDCDDKEKMGLCDFI